MKNILVGLLLALIPSVALAESKGQKAIVADLQDIGVLIMGHTAGCGVADFESIKDTVSGLSRVYGLLNERELSEDVLQIIVQSELELGAEIGDSVISDEGCFQFNKYIVQYRYDLNTVDDVFTLYVPTSGV